MWPFLNPFFFKKLFCLEMEGVTVDHVDAVVDESYFENESSSNSSWEFCNQTTLPRSEVVFFVQRFYCITANITLYCSINRFKTKLWRNFDIVKLNWILFLTKSKTMKKVISTRDRVFVDIAGPSGCGKTELIFKMLSGNTFYPKSNNIKFLYRQMQQIYIKMEHSLGAKFKKFSE